jgi:signal transduction histidine kinase
MTQATEPASARKPRRLTARVGLAAAFVLILANAVYSLVMLRGLEEATGWAEHSQAVQIELDHLRGAVKDAEIGADGYLLSPTAEALAAYRDSKANTEHAIGSVQTLTADNPSQQGRVGEMEADIKDFFGRLDETIAARSGPAGAVGPAPDELAAITAAIGKVRAGVEAMQAEEKRLYEERRNLAERRHVVTQILLAIGAIASLILLTFLFRQLETETKRADSQVRARTAELTSANEALKTEVVSREKAEMELRRLNETLEQRVAEEIESRLKAEERLGEAQKMEAVGQLTGGVAHDFNNLLTVIVGNLETLLRRLPKELPLELAQTRRFAESALEGGQRAVTLTRRLLAFSRRQPLEAKPIDMNKLVSGMSDLLRSTLGEKVAIETVLAGGIWWVSTDGSELETALVNLAVNARDAMPGGGKLTIETANSYLDESYAAGHPEVTAGQYAMVAVSDTGVGMPKEVVAHAFEPFFTTKDVGQGTGLGLSQVYGFVKQSGGHVKIYSEAGQGTTVRIYLPRLVAGDSAAVAGEPQAPRRQPAAAAGRETVLIVEDDEGVRGYSAEMLRELGYQVLEASDGAEALRLIEKSPDLALLFTDVGLPGGLNGRQLADEVRRRRPKLKVLYTTGYARNAIVHQGRLDPGVDLIVKPFTFQNLAAKLRAVLDS